MFHFFFFENITRSTREGAKRAECLPVPPKSRVEGLVRWTGSRLTLINCVYSRAKIRFADWATFCRFNPLNLTPVAGFFSGFLHFYIVSFDSPCRRRSHGKSAVAFAFLRLLTPPTFNHSIFKYALITKMSSKPDIFNFDSFVKAVFGKAKFLKINIKK